MSEYKLPHVVGPQAQLIFNSFKDKNKIQCVKKLMLEILLTEKYNIHQIFIPD